MPRFRVSILRHVDVYCPGEQPVMSKDAAHRLVRIGAAEIIEELPDLPIHGAPTGGSGAAILAGYTPAPLPINEGIDGEPIGGSEPPQEATQADVDASLGQNRAHRPNRRRKIDPPTETTANTIAETAVSLDAVLSPTDDDADPFAGT